MLVRATVCGEAMLRWNRHGLVGRVPERTFLAAAVQRLHESRDGPVVVIADDLHVAQPPTRPLRTLLSLTRERPVLVVLAYRPRQLPVALSEVAIIGLTPLGPAEAGALLDSRDDVGRSTARATAIRSTCWRCPARRRSGRVR
jgi:hypothetical protein